MSLGEFPALGLKNSRVGADKSKSRAKGGNTNIAKLKRVEKIAQARVEKVPNFAMVEAYWHIGKRIVEKQGGETRAEYGAGLIADLSARMTADFGKGFTTANLKNMRQFYVTFPNGYALRSELSWSHYRLLMRVENPL